MATLAEKLDMALAQTTPHPVVSVLLRVLTDWATAKGETVLAQKLGEIRDRVRLARIASNDWPEYTDPEETT